MTDKINPIVAVTYAANIAAEVQQYQNWTPEFAKEHITARMAKIQKQIQDEVDFSTMSIQELDAWGFGKWTDEASLRLVPLWLLPALRPGTVLESISGKKVTVGTDNIDNDNRAGFTAFGFPIYDYVSKEVLSPAEATT